MAESVRQEREGDSKILRLQMPKLYEKEVQLIPGSSESGYTKEENFGRGN